MQSYNIGDQSCFDALKQRNIHLLFAAGLLIIDLLLTFAMVSVTGRWHSIIIPPGFSQSFWLNHAGVSAPYLAEMTRYFAGLVLNITSDNATLQREENLNTPIQQVMVHSKHN